MHPQHEAVGSLAHPGGTVGAFHIAVRRQRWAPALLSLSLLATLAACDEGGDLHPEAMSATTVVEEPGEVEPVSPEPAPVDAAETFAIDDVRAQAELTPGLFMVLGTSPGPAGGLPVLTLGGAVQGAEGWTVALNARFGPCADEGEGDRANRAEGLVPGSAALVVRCDEGEGRSTVYVFGAPPGTQPGVLLQISCGNTGYELRGSRIAITSTDERGRRRADLEFALEGPILDTPVRLPAYCDRLDD